MMNDQTKDISLSCKCKKWGQNHNWYCREIVWTLPAPILPVWKKWACAAMVFLGIIAATLKAKSQERTTVEVEIDTLVSDGTDEHILGKTARVPENSGLVQLRKYLSNNLLLASLINESIVVTFFVDNKGNLFNHSVGDRLPKSERLKLLKALKKVPRPKAGNFRTDYPYSLWISIKNGRILPFYEIN